MDQTPTISAPDVISAHLRMILRGVLAVLGMWRLDVVQMRLVHRRFSATFLGIERLLVRYRAGKLWRVAPRDSLPRQRGCRVATVVLPRRFGWLVQAGGYQAVGFGLQLQVVLSAPEMVALLAESPQARRMLRPLCRALAMEWAGAPNVAVQSTPRAQRQRAKRPAFEPFRIPLPRGVLAAARRQGFGKMC
jgi:hypothetical protein